MSKHDTHDEQAHFARTGVLSPTGPLTEPLKTFVDFETAEAFRRLTNEADMDVSSALRDWVFKLVHQKTFTEMVADAQKVKSAKLFGTGPIADQNAAKQ
ncbi:MAG: hypothetical protein WAW73_20235 [Rhodoferax sp.]